MTPFVASQDRVLPGVALMLAFCIIAPLIDVFSKLAAQAVPVGQVTTARFVVQAVLMAPLMLLYAQPWGLTRQTARLLALRALVSITSTFSFVAAVQVMPLADALAIGFVEPFIVLLLGKLIYGEQVGPRRIGASVVGFGGALLVIQPSFAEFGWTATFPLGTAFSFALYILFTRQLSRQMHPVAMQTHTALFASAMCLPLLWLAEGSGIRHLDPVWPDALNLGYLCGVGLAATVSHMFITYALQKAPSSTLAPLHYLEIVTSVALGYYVFSDFPNALTWAGIAIIVASGLYIIHRERVLAQRRP